MAALWPWLAIAGAGALHGLSPANGWMLAAACGVHARDEAQARRALRPIAFGQVAAMAALAWAVSQGLSLDRALMRDLAVGLLLAATWWLAQRGASQAVCIATPAGDAGIALWSFLMASAQGAGMMLVPALLPLCAGGAAREVAAAGTLAMALGAVAVHTAAMLLTSGLLARGLVGALGHALGPRWHRSAIVFERRDCTLP